MPASIIDEPYIAFGRETCGDIAASIRREWLVTNAIGGYASGTLFGVSSRSYHGLLIAALEPPVGRNVLVGASVEQATYRGKRYWLSTNEYAEAVFAPEGYRNLSHFRLEGGLPVWTYAVADALIERRLWMVNGKNTTYVTYTMARGTAPADLEITPLVTYRDHHVLTSGQGWHMHVERQEHGALDKAFEDAFPLRLLTDSGDFRTVGRWYWNFRYRAETQRGLNDHGDLYAPGSFTKRLEPGQTLTVVYSVENDVDLDGPKALAAEQARQRGLLAQANAESADPIVQQLVLAADQFIVSRPAAATDGATSSGTSIIAGYHWFADWGRDTMISLPGLALATGRARDAESILRTFGRFITDGLLPNGFPERVNGSPDLNTVDASLWYVLAVHRYCTATGDRQLLVDLLPGLLDIIDHYTSGTRYDISVDEEDGLVRAGEPGLQLTWMDAKVDGWVVTPRTGKPVEVNALWYNALRIVADALAASDDPRGAEMLARAERTRESFLARFSSPDRVHLADVIDGPNGDDWSVRPNQIFAVSLPFPLIEGDHAKRIVEAIGQTLLTSYGLRTLSSDDPAFTGVYGGDRVARDGAYHQGTVWAWLLGAYAEAVYATTSNLDAALELLRPIGDHLRDAGLGTISEIFDGDPPHAPRGAIAQAWSVGEILRVWRMLEAHGMTSDSADAAVGP